MTLLFEYITTTFLVGITNASQKEIWEETVSHSSSLSWQVSEKHSQSVQSTHACKDEPPSLVQVLTSFSVHLRCLKVGVYTASGAHCCGTRLRGKASAWTYKHHTPILSTSRSLSFFVWWRKKHVVHTSSEFYSRCIG